jgi:hypothetical protein
LFLCFSDCGKDACLSSFWVDFVVVCLCSCKI